MAVLALSFAAILSASAFALVLPATLGRLVDIAQTGSDPEAAIIAVAWAAASIGGAVIIGAAASALGFFGVSRIVEPVLARLREQVVSATLTLPQRVVDRVGGGDLVARATDDVALAADTLPGTIPIVARSGFAIVLTLIGLAVLDPWFLLIVVIVAPIHVYAVRRYLREAPPVYAAERAASAQRGHYLLDGLRGASTVRAFGLEAWQLSRIGAASWSAVRSQMRARAIQNGFFSRLNAAEFAGMAGILVIGFVRMGDGSVSAGAVTVATLFFLALFGPIGELLFVIDDVQLALAALGRSVGVLVIDGDPDPRQTIDHGVSLRDVHFAYREREVIRGVDLEIAPGERIALVGASGAGKSTVAALVHGSLPASSGTVAVSGAATRAVLVSQEMHVFSGSVRDNLTLVAPDATDAQLHAALEAVGAAHVVDALPQGLDTEVGAGGATVPAADAQLLALARALLAEPGLVILDEPTAEAGSSSAAVLDRATARVLEGRSALVIAHRLDQAQAADRIIVMREGEIVESGAHAALVDADGEYARLWDAWSRGR